MIKKIALLLLGAHLGLMSFLPAAAQDQSQEITDEDVLNLNDKTLDSILLDILGPADEEGGADLPCR